MSKFRYPQPSNEDAFEEFCLALLREVWSQPHLERYGHRGEDQYGVDLLDMSGRTPLLAVQCKHHDPTKTLSPAELEAEVSKAVGFPDLIGEYFVLTTAKRGRRTHEKLRKLNEEHRAKKLFTIQLMTWDDIERLIDDSPAARQFLGLDPTSATIRAIRAEVQPLQQAISDQVAQASHADLDEAKARLEKGEPQIALIFLERTRQRSWADLSPGQRARLNRLEADARMRFGDAKAAARLLLQASAILPDDEPSAANAVVAHQLLDDHTKALELAIAAKARFPNLAAAHAATIELAPSFREAIAAVEAVPPAIADSADVLAAIGMRLDLGERAVAASKQLTELAPNDPRGWFALGSVLLERERQRTNPLGIGRSERISRENLEQARTALEAVVGIAAKGGNIGMQVAARLRRMVASALLDDDVAVEADAGEALRLTPSDPLVLVAVGRAALQRREAETAVNTLRQAVMRGGDADARFMLAIALWNRNGGEQADRVEATRLLIELATSDATRSELAVEMAVEGLLGAANSTQAAALMDSAAAHLERVLVETLRARIAGTSGDESVARSCADAALASLSPATSRSTHTKLAKVLMAQGRFSDALTVLERVANAGGDEDAGRRLVECAMRLGRHELVLKYCEDARNIGIFDDYLLSRELPLLDRYDPAKAIAVLTEVIAREPSKHEARVHLVAIAHRLGREELVREHLASLPRVGDVDASEGATVVAILREYGAPRQAISYAYDLLRRHFGDHHAHRAFRDATLWTPPEEKEGEVPQEVRPGVAVAITERDETRWYVIEDSTVDSPPIENELRPDAPLARLLVGKRVGDEVVLDGPGVRRTARVTEIVLKRVYRFRDVLNQWQFRFPDQNEMWMLRVTNEDGATDFASLFDVLRHSRERTEEAEKVYKEHTVPMGPFSTYLGANEIRAVGHIAAREGLRLRCCRGTRDEQEDAATALASASEIVLDPTAIATLILAEDFELLEALAKRILVSQSTMLLLRELAADANRKAEGSMEDTPDGPRLEVASEERQANAKAFLSRMLSWFEGHAVVTSAVELASLAPEMRKELEELLGACALESAIIATAPSRLLWTDDGVAALVVKERLGVRRVWTQAASDWLTKEGRIPAERHARLSARLIGWGYSFTSANDGILRSAGTIADWDLLRAPLKQAIEYLALPEVRPQDALSLAAFLIRDAYRHPSLPQRRRPVMLAALAALRRRSDLNERAFDELGAALPRIFGLDALGCDDAMRTFAAWRAGTPRIVLPSGRPRNG